MSNIGSSYGDYAAAHPGTLPAGAYIGTPGSWAWIPTLGLLGTFTILLFPDGHLPSPRWRWVGWLAAVSIGVLTFAAFVYPAGPASAPNPFALPGAKPLLDALQATIFLLIGAIILSLVSIVVRYRRGDRERREQLRWLMFAAGALVALYGVGNVAIELIAPVHNGAATPVWQQVYAGRHHASPTR